MSSKTNNISENYLGKKRNISYEKKEKSLSLKDIENELSNIDTEEIDEINNLKNKFKEKRNKLKDKINKIKEEYFEEFKEEIIHNQKDYSKEMDKIIKIIEDLEDSQNLKQKNNIIKIHILLNDKFHEHNIIPNFIFGNNMSNEKFLELFKYILITINNKKSKNTNEIKSFFNTIGNNALYTLLDNKVLTKIKKDLILQYCIDRGIYNRRTSMSTKFIIELSKGVNNSEFCIEEFNLDFIERKASDNSQIFKINKEKIREFLKSEAVLSTVQETLSQIKDNNLNNVQKIILQKKAEEFIDKTKFYKMKMNDDDNDKKIFSFTIYNGSVFLNEKYIQIANDNNDMRGLSALAIIITTIFHEFANFLARVLSNENFNSNYFLSTKNRQINDSGDYMDSLLLGEYLGFYEIDALFLLNLNNYSDSYKLFCQKFKLNKKNNWNKLEEGTFLKKGNGLDDSTFLKRERCLYSLLRGC